MPRQAPQPICINIYFKKIIKKKKKIKKVKCKKAIKCVLNTSQFPKIFTAEV